MSLDKQLAKRIISKVSFKDRFIAGRLRHHSGVKRITSYSFEEVITLFSQEIPVIQFELLIQWIQEVIGDKELAEKVVGIVKQKTDYFETLQKIKTLMIARLEQSRKIYS